MAFAFTPSTLVCLVSGYLWGVSTLPWVIISYILASALGFEVPKWMDEGRLIRTLHTIPKVAKFIDGVTNESFWWVLVTRLLPALPFAVVNVIFSLLQVNRRNYYLGGILGMLPRTCFAVWVGSQGDSFIHNDFIYRKEVWIPSIVVVVLLVVRYLWVKFWR
ncbi:MAG: VTT domain-containing protein [Cytophagales bacterium]|nr:VTT domain-containing protein [Cytophagales bacterium]